MKQKKNKDISILLYGLLLFSFAIGWIYSKSAREANEKNNYNNKIETLADSIDKAITENATKIQETLETQKTQDSPEIKTTEPQKTQEAKKTVSTIIIPKAPEPPAEIASDDKSATEQEELTLEEIIEYSKELVNSKSINNLVTLLKEKCPENIIVQTINELLTRNKEELTRYEKLKIILALAKYYETDKKIEKQIFDLITKDKNLETGRTPTLFAAIEIKESEVIPALFEWYKKSDRPDIKNIAQETLEFASKNDFGNAIKKLHENGVKINPEEATKLLWANIKSNKTNKNSKTIEILKSLGADLNNHNPETKFTILIQAIKNKNLETVKQLVKFGANPKIPSKDKNVGFPLQIARELNLLEVENFLRSNGAKD